MEMPREISEYDRRRHPRYLVEMPLDFVDGQDDLASTGLTTNVSERGLMALIGERLEVGSILKVTLYFRSDFSLTSIQTQSQIMWRDDVWKEYLDSYRYGLMFLGAKHSEMKRLKGFLQRSERQETLYIPDDA
jgi:hypothetical protein